MNPENNNSDDMGVRHPVITGLAVIAVFFFGFGTWAALAPLESAAIAPGIVVVDSNRKTIQHLEGGIVRDILITEGARVSAGDPLVVLDDTQPRASMGVQKGQLRAATALKARLEAERDGKDSVVFPDWIYDEAETKEVSAIIEGQRKIFTARRKSLSTQSAILEKRANQHREEITGLKAEIKSQEDQLTLIKDQLGRMESLFKKRLARRSQLVELQQQHAGIKGTKARNTASIARAQQSIAETSLQAEELNQSRLSEIVAELREVETQIFDLADRIRLAENVLSRTIIQAPVSGTIVGLKVFTSGGVIAPGAPILDIVPDNDVLIIEARINTEDIDVVHVGLAARVRITAFSRRTTPELDGEMIYVSADRMKDERTDEPYYTARIALTTDGSDFSKSLSLYPGMSAEVVIVTGKRTLLDYLFNPVLATFDRALHEA